MMKVTTVFPQITSFGEGFVIGDDVLCEIDKNELKINEKQSISFQCPLEEAENGRCTDCLWHHSGDALYHINGKFFHRVSVDIGSSKVTFSECFTDLGWSLLRDDVVLKERWAGAVGSVSVAASLSKGLRWTFQTPTINVGPVAAFLHEDRLHILDLKNSTVFSAAAHDNLTFRIHDVHFCSNFDKWHLAELKKRCVVRGTTAYIMMFRNPKDHESQNPDPLKGAVHLFKLNLRTFVLTDITAELRKRSEIHGASQVLTYNSCFYVSGENKNGEAKIWKVEMEDGKEEKKKVHEDECKTCHEFLVKMHKVFGRGCDTCEDCGRILD